MQKDEPVIAAEIEEMEDEAGKTLPESEVTRSKREATKTVASVPLHFEASANQTDKSVHLTVTVRILDLFSSFRLHTHFRAQTPKQRRQLQLTTIRATF